jgi:hypothetical protein
MQRLASPSALPAPCAPARRALLHGLGSAALGSALAILFAPAARAAEAGSFEAAAHEFQRANAGVESAIEPAVERFGALLLADPANPVLLAYSGAATAMRARTTLLPWKKMGFAEDGLAQVDKALALLTPAHDAPLYRGTPASLEVRFTAASVFLAMPSMFNRHARGTKLLDEVLASPLFAPAPLGFRGAVWLRAGAEAIAEKRTEDARRLLQLVLSSGAPQAEQASAKLREITS